MSLAQFSEAKRLVVQNSSTSVYDAARALENNHVGAVVVQDDGKVTGIVTDRDLALRVIGYDLDPKQIPLRDVMTPHPATLPSAATEQDAFELMRDRHVRRIPIVDGEKVTGIVTLDDLILAGAIGWVGAAAIVQAQLTEPAPAKPAGVPFPVRPAFASRTRSWRSDSEARHIARAERTLRAFTERLTQEVGLK
ncbi:MAG TPA: CBS domain-containing protein, partial [Polyangiaceae bacterium]